MSGSGIIEAVNGVVVTLEVDEAITLPSAQPVASARYSHEPLGVASTSLGRFREIALAQTDPRLGEEAEPDRKTTTPTTPPPTTQPPTKPAPAPSKPFRDPGEGTPEGPPDGPGDDDFPACNFPAKFST